MTLIASALVVLLVVGIPASAHAGGWYLLAPHDHTVEETLRAHPNLKSEWEIAKATLALEQPLSRWVHVWSFDTALECEEFLTPPGLVEPTNAIQRFLSQFRATRKNRITMLDIRTTVPDAIAKKYPGLQSMLDLIQGSYSRCIASDDPRLDPRGPKRKRDPP